jgi:hypothetical protein
MRVCDPSTAETLSCGRQVDCFSRKNLDYDGGWNLFCGITFDAVGSVACLECSLEDSGSDVYVLAGT